MMIGNFLSGCVYIVFIANTFHGICNDAFGWDLSVRIYILMVMIPIVFIGQIRNLKYLVPCSALGNFFILTTLGIVFYYIFKESLPFKERPLIVNYTKWPIFFR